MKRVFVDTGAWYALLDRKDPDHAKVVACLHTYNGRLISSNYIFDETLTLVRYRLGWQIAVLFGEQVRDTRLTHLVSISPQDEDAAWDIFKKYQDKSFSFTDCSSFALMERLKISTAVAIDGDFKAYGLHCIP